MVTATVRVAFENKSNVCGYPADFAGPWLVAIKFTQQLVIKLFLF